MGQLTGKIKRGFENKNGRIKSGGDLVTPMVENDFLFNVVDVLKKLAKKVGKPFHKSP